MLPNELRLTVETLTDEQLRELTDLVLYTEPQRRRRERAMAEAIAALRQTGEIEGPKAATITDTEGPDLGDVPYWVNPEGKRSRMYSNGDVVRVGDEIFQSEYQGLNGWEPGAPGVGDTKWRNVTALWILPEGARFWDIGLDVKAGDLIRFSGVTYRAIKDHKTVGRLTPPRATNLYEPVPEDEPAA